MIALMVEYETLRTQMPGIQYSGKYLVFEDTRIFDLIQRTHLQLLQDPNFSHSINLAYVAKDVERCKDSFARIMSKAWNTSITANHLFFLPPEPVGWMELFQSLQKQSIEPMMMVPALPSICRMNDPSITWLPPNPKRSSVASYSLSYSYELKESAQRQAVILASPNPITGGILPINLLTSLYNYLSHQNGLLILDQTLGTPIPSLIDTPIDTPTNSFYLPGMLSLHRLSMWGFGIDAPILLIGEPHLISLFRRHTGSKELLSPWRARIMATALENDQLAQMCQTIHPTLMSDRKNLVLTELNPLAQTYPIHIHEHAGGTSLWVHLDQLAVNTSTFSKLLQGKGVWIPDARWFLPVNLSYAKAVHECLSIGLTEQESVLSQTVEALVYQIKKSYSR